MFSTSFSQFDFVIKSSNLIRATKTFRNAMIWTAVIFSQARLQQIAILGYTPMFGQIAKFPQRKCITITPLADMMLNCSFSKAEAQAAVQIPSGHPGCCLVPGQMLHTKVTMPRFAHQHVGSSCHKD
jgi:hypothetical protein